MPARFSRCVTVVIVMTLPLALPQLPSHSPGLSVLSMPPAMAEGALNRIMRWTGYGWSCGYHACNDPGACLSDALPPVGNTAHRNDPTGRGRFELVEPTPLFAHPPRHSHSHAAGQVIHHHHYVPSPLNLPGSVLMGPMEATPSSELGDSLMTPQPAPPAKTFQPYRSAVPPKRPLEPAPVSEDDRLQSPSDVELLPVPNGNRDPLDDLMDDDDAAVWMFKGNRSAGRSKAAGVR